MNKLYLKFNEEISKTDAVLKLYWSRKPGNFVNKLSGADVTFSAFTGTIREWYETLIETVIDAVNRAELNNVGLIVSRDVLTIMECCLLYKPHCLYSEKGEFLRDPMGVPLEHETLKGIISYKGTLVFVSDTIERNRIVLFDLAGKTAEVEIKNMDVL